MTVEKTAIQSCPRIMGILNVTPDSFSDGGAYRDMDGAVARGLDMVRQGADIIDIGGESSRPGSSDVSAEEEMDRVLPVVEALAARVDVPISIDTVKPQVAAAALAAGASILNDVSNLRDGDGMARLAAERGGVLLLVHSRGTPATMRDFAEYEDVVGEVAAELTASVAGAMALGVPEDKIWIDPGIGFAKRPEQSISLIANLASLAALGYPVVVGPSRKAFISAVDASDVTRRLGGTAAAVTAAVLNGAAIVRVHDVEEMRQAARLAHAFRRAGRRERRSVHV